MKLLPYYKNRLVPAVCAFLVESAFSSLYGGITVLEDDFDPSLDALVWDSLSNHNVQNGSEFFSGNALRFDGDGTRSAQTIEVNTIGGGVVSFRLKIGGANDTALFEQADSGEDIRFSYSTDGSLWTPIVTYDTLDASFSDNWGFASVNIPIAAQSTTSQFRWDQITNSGNSFDNWGLDDVAIVVVPELSSMILVCILFGSLGGIHLIRKRK